MAGGASRVLKNTAFLAVARVIDRVSTLIVTLLIASELGAEGLGAYAVAPAREHTSSISAPYATVTAYSTGDIRGHERRRRLPLRFDPGLAWRLVKELRSFAGSSALAALFARPEILMLSLLASEREAASTVPPCGSRSMDLRSAGRDQPAAVLRRRRSRSPGASQSRRLSWAPPAGCSPLAGAVGARTARAVLVRRGSRCPEGPLPRGHAAPAQPAARPARRSAGRVDGTCA
jgi:hypothetical protein